MKSVGSNSRRRHELGAEREEAVLSLDPQHRAAVGVAEVVHPDVVRARVAGDVVEHLVDRDALHPPADDDRELALVVEEPRALRHPDRAAVAVQRRRRLDEVRRLGRRPGGVLLDARAVRQVDGEDLRRLGRREIRARRSRRSRRRRRARSRRRRAGPSAARRRPRRGRGARRAQRWDAYSSTSQGRRSRGRARRRPAGTARPRSASSRRTSRRAPRRAARSSARVRLERVERRAEVGREPRPGVRVVHAVGVARRPGRVARARARSRRGREQERRNDQVRAGGAVARADLDARRGSRARCGTRQNAVRLSWPQLPWVGARLSGRMRLYALTVGPSSAWSPCACSSTPAMKLRGERAEPVRPALVGERVVAVGRRRARCGGGSPSRPGRRTAGP